MVKVDEYEVLEGLYYSEDYMWVKVEDGKARVGITDYAQKQLREIVFVELPSEGDEVTQGEPFGTVESVKAVSDLVAPLSGTVESVNEEVVEIAKREWRKVKQEAADIGSAIHEWIEKYIKGEEQDMPADEKVLNGVKAFLDFQKENKFEWVLSEKKVYHPKFKYAGILDALAKTKDGYVLVDFKSSNGIYSEMALQVAAYDMALKEMIQWIKPKRYMIIRFGKNDGQFDWRDITHIICLLYTSPSPRDLSTSRMPSSA